MILSSQHVETLQKALAASTETNRTTGRTGRHRDEEITRRWKVSVSELGNPVLETSLQNLLETLHQEALSQFDIGIRGASDATEVRVHIWSRRMDIMAFVSPEDFGGDVSAAILQTLTDLVADFGREP
jgi:hypothetical protein